MQIKIVEDISENSRCFTMNVVLIYWSEVDETLKVDGYLPYPVNKKSFAVGATATCKYVSIDPDSQNGLIALFNPVKSENSFIPDFDYLYNLFTFGEEAAEAAS